LQKFIEAKDNLNELEERTYSSFEFTHELAWKMKDYFEYQGNTTITGSRDATRSLSKGLIQDGGHNGWK
jgi:hypothetical protein